MLFDTSKLVDQNVLNFSEEKRVVVEAETKVAVEPEPEPEPVKAVVVKKSVKAEEKPRAASGNGKMATVAYDYWAHNVKELTIRAGEKVMVSWSIYLLRHVGMSDGQKKAVYVVMF